MGIHPGTTSASQAVVLLKNSETTKKLEIFGNTIVASSTEFNVVLRFSSGVVESLHLTTASLTLGEMISVLGKPKDVKLNNNCGITTNFRCLYYQIYYPAWNTLIRIEPQDRAGPSSHDIVRVININLLDEWKEPSQPWLGYGHADEYMHNVPLPSPTPYPLR
jgi:hypothetical protein